MKKLLRVLITLAGVGLGCGIVALIIYSFKFPGYDYVMRYTTDTTALAAIYVISGLLSGLIFYFIAPKLIDDVKCFFQGIERRITETPAMDLFFGVLGIILGLLLAYLLSLVVQTIQLPVVPGLISFLLYVFCGYFGGRIAVSRRTEFLEGARGRTRLTALGGARAKVLDTSVIIDGRILDICKTGFVEGPIVVPGFVLKELRHIADSADTMKRNRGRRGLDILKEMQAELPIEIRIEERDYDDVDEVDIKLLRLATELGGVLVTNDYNLNKVALVQSMQVLNINDLANAIRPVLLPGEDLRLAVVKEGKELGQGVGYLEDGTMVIVENGRKRIGDTVDLVVTSALQTSAGRLIFARIKG